MKDNIQGCDKEMVTKKGLQIMLVGVQFYCAFDRYLSLNSIYRGFVK